MLLRCLQANSSFEEEWASLGGPRLQTGLRQGEPPGQTGRASAKGTFEGVGNLVCFWIWNVHRNVLLKSPYSSLACYELIVLLNSFLFMPCVLPIQCLFQLPQYCWLVCVQINVGFCFFFLYVILTGFVFVVFCFVFSLTVTFPQKLSTGRSAWIQRR